MNILKSYIDYESLIAILNSVYKLNINEIFLHRDMIGHVYIAKSSSKKYALKVYRPFNQEQALQSVEIIQYLRSKEYPVVSIVSAVLGDLSFSVATPDGQCIAILFDYIEGTEPNSRAEITEIGEQIGSLHNLMNNYLNPLICRGKNFYIDRFIEMLRESQYCEARIKELEQYGFEIWKSIEKAPSGFCHGDLHTGNMFKNEIGEYVLFDFDIASNAYPLIDITTICNDTDFNKLEEATYDSTALKLEQFYKGYGKYRNISDDEIVAIYNFIAARHYELIATITECQGWHSLKNGLFDEQYKWLLKWRDICYKKKLR